MRAAWLLICVLASVWASQAEAQKRVVVEDFAGPQSGRVRSQLLANLQRQDDLVLVSRDEVRDAARRLRIRGRNYTEDQYAELARELDVAAFVDGRTSRRRRAWALTIRVRSGADGMVLGSESWGGRTMGSLSAVRRNGYRRLSSYFDAAQSPVQQAPQQQVAAAVGTEASGDTPWYAQGDEEVPPGAEGDEEDEGFEPIAGDARQDAFRASLLVGTLRRSMAAQAIVQNNCTNPASEFCRDPSVMGTIPEERTYTSGGPGHPEAGIELEFYPGALGEEQAIPWFGLVGRYRHSIFLSSSGPSRDGSMILDVPTSQSELYLGARGRHRFGDDPRGVEGVVDLGYGNFNFTLDPEALKLLHPTAVVPPMDYSYVLIGVSASYGADPVYARVGIEADYRLGLGVGKEAKEIWGTQTTDTSGFGLGLFLHSQAPYIGEGFFFRLAVQYFQFSTTFRGQTACVDPDFNGMGGCQESDPWEVWPYTGNIEDNEVTGGIREPVTDSYFRLGLAFGWALR